MSDEAITASDGTTRAAILLLTIGERLAADVLKYLDPKEVQRLGMAISRMRSVSRKEVQATLCDFLAQAVDRMPLGIGTEEYLMKSLGSAVGKDRARELINQIMAGRLGGMDAVRHMDAPAVTDLLRHEHPQIAAIVLANIDPDHAAEVLALLPEAQRPELITRVANLESLPPAALRELDAIIDQKVSDAPGIHSSRIGGVKAAVDMLNHLDRNLGEDILGTIREADPELGLSLDEALFAFEDLAEVADRDIQALLKEIPTDLLVKALKATEERVRGKIFKNMSKRASQLIRDDIEGAGPVRLADVEQAQKEIVRIARQLAERGDMNLGVGEEYV
jgi:flagellar motor switch protein FliG